VVVDYGCPDKAGRWVTELRSPRARAILMTPELTRYTHPHFNKPRALNAAASSVAKRTPGARLLLLDADTRVLRPLPGTTGCMMQIADPADGDDLLGVLGVELSDFLAVGGASPCLEGYGMEDLDLRLRLYLRRGLAWERFPAGSFSAIPHSDELRTAHYVEKNKFVTGERNLRGMLERLTQAERDRLRSDPEAQALTKLTFLENQA
jgi:hypothetical protein